MRFALFHHSLPFTPRSVTRRGAEAGGTRDDGGTSTLWNLLAIGRPSFLPASSRGRFPSGDRRLPHERGSLHWRDSRPLLIPGFPGSRTQTQTTRLPRRKREPMPEHSGCTHIHTRSRSRPHPIAPKGRELRRWSRRNPPLALSSHEDGGGVFCCGRFRGLRGRRGKRGRERDPYL
jgi:hypothetical protein